MLRQHGKHISAPGPNQAGATVGGRSSLHASSARLAAMGTALLLVVFLVLSTSRAAFTATTNNPTNSMSTGTLTLSDDDAGTAMFDTITGLVPLTTTTRCIHVQYVGSLDPQPIVLYVPSSPTGSLGTYLDLTIEIGPNNADAFGSCASFTNTATLYTGTLAGFATSHSGYASGQATWDPSTNSTQTFRFTAAAGQSAGWGFTWETRSA